MAQRRGRGIVYQIIGTPQAPAQVDLLEIRWTVPLVQQPNFLKRTQPQGHRRSGDILDGLWPIVLPLVDLAIAIVPRECAAWFQPGAGMLQCPAVGIVDFAADCSDAFVLLEW